MLFLTFDLENSTSPKPSRRTFPPMLWKKLYTRSVTLPVFPTSWPVTLATGSTPSMAGMLDRSKPRTPSASLLVPSLNVAAACRWAYVFPAASVTRGMVIFPAAVFGSVSLSAAFCVSASKFTPGAVCASCAVGSVANCGISTVPASCVRSSVGICTVRPLRS